MIKYQNKSIDLILKENNWTDPEIRNFFAFLDMISYAEGTNRFGDQHGYNVIVGGSTFNDYSRHPNKLIKLNSKLSSTAAGRYQILYRFWTHYSKLLNLPDFSPLSQDLYVLQILKEQRALDAVRKGDIKTAIERCANIWASFPNAGYGQREVKMNDLLKYHESRL